MIMLTIILNILLPPLAVFLKHGLGVTFLISLLLTALGWVPGVIHAFIVNGSD
ncbi:YqaE/Pmp3 family membrane protein [Salegentibacter sp. LM13S]|uniref:YqaE/Pmp3 family membrane protein n=1 Tax=Salegentibacter lacus TaxID=2873599 RepID=UPI001CCC8F70|nr:YqaE/Pmp3 family membrane protein [Salegentibacter lacus]MBZ9632261.1 YqaE/Pmp3 family membrane protein [Salegentibacter lacus]